MKALLRASFASLVGSVALLSAPAAFAVGEDCLNDTDCPGTECGTDVCSWNMPKTNPTNPDKPYTCVAVGTDPMASKGKEGWCSDKNSDFCKCKAQGATCSSNIFYCTFVKPSDAPAGSGGSGSGGTSVGTAGTTTTTPTAGTSATGGSSSAPAAAEEGGCSVSAPGRVNTGIAAGVALLGLGVAFARRRRG